MAEKQKSVPFLKKYWVSQIGVFLLSQIIFITFETTGWILIIERLMEHYLGKLRNRQFLKNGLLFMKHHN